MSDYNEIRNALNHLDANDRDFWVKMGAAVKDELGEDGFELWDEWSRHSENYKSNDAKAVWKSLKQGHIHIGTLFYHARENGYHPNKPYTHPVPKN
ncbi:PriCT-2 domain-containing protein [Neisseria gonorrhoeae]|uniref:PriCT-2 domain-containing protein n=1 Tax=Neisseria gonorrhoeae TaxID=485 RepID=UPI003365086A